MAKIARDHHRLKANVRLNYAPQGDVLRRFHLSDQFIRDLIGPLGSGKTQACMADILMLIDRQAVGRRPGAFYGVRASRWLVVRNTYRDLQTTTIKDWLAFTEPLRIGKFSQGNNGEPPHWNCHYTKPDGSTVLAEVLFESFDSGSDEKKGRGKQLTGVWFNERKELKKINVDQLHGRVGRYPPKAEVPDAEFRIIGDSNAPDRDHWLARLALEEQPENWGFFIQPGGLIMDGGQWVRNMKAENINNLPDNYYTAQIGGKKDSWIRKNLANEFVFHSDGMPIHPSFSERYHVGRTSPDPTLPIHVGVDFGRTPAATIGQRNHRGQWQIFRELVTENTSAKTFGELLRDVLAAEYAGFVTHIYGDPAGNDMAQTRDETPLDMMNLAGLDAIPAPTNDFEIRTTSLDSLLTKLIDGEPAVIVDHTCSTVIRGLAGAYQFKRVQIAGDDRFHNKPDKGPESHACESLHYLLCGAGVGFELYDTQPQHDYQSENMARYFE